MRLGECRTNRSVIHNSLCVDDVDVEVVPDGVVVVVGVLLDARVALAHAVRAQTRVAPLQARSPAVPEEGVSS